MSMDKLESKIGKQGGKKSAKLVYSSLGLLVIGLGVVYAGLAMIRGNVQISADTEEVSTPPVPSEPTAVASSSSTTVANPPTPGELTGEVDDDTWAFPSGWSMINGEFLEGADMGDFSDAGLILYSFNDPAYANREWSTFPWGSSASSSAENVIPYTPFGYYVYNPGESTVTIDFTRAEATHGELTIARGWHLMYWPNETASKDKVLSSLNLQYQDGTALTAAEAITSQYHRVSLKVYGIVNENVVDETSALKELTGTSSDTTLSSIPAKSYFWLYVRRTKSRIVDISISE